MHKTIVKYILGLVILVAMAGGVFTLPGVASDVFSVDYQSDSIAPSAKERLTRRERREREAGLKGDTTIHVDSLLMPNRDSTASDTTSAPFLDDPIFGTGTDSLIYDLSSKDVFLYKKADIKYQDMELNADYMKLNTKSKLVHARGITDTATQVYSRPVFTQDKATYDMDSIIYNMESGKARITGVNTKEGEGILSGGTVKKMKDNVVHMHQGRYTTCDATCPHFYLQMTKGSVVPGKKTVFGPAYMVIEDVPIYFLGLPFGFFPQKSERNSGFIMPEIGEEVAKGFFIRNGGYYFVINDYVDVAATLGIYTLGSWQGNVISSYTKRYKFSGNLAFDYAKDVIGEKGAADYLNTSNIRIAWTHRQDPKSHPNSTFSASVNYSSSSYNKYNAHNMQDYLNSQVTSSVAYSKNWVGTPFSLAINAQMSQNTQDSAITLDLPSFTFNVARVSPFKRKVAVGKERWYEKISFTYNTEFRNTVNIKERELFKPEMFDKMRLGMRHNIPIQASFNILKYLNVTPSATYTERWYFRRIDQNWDTDTEKLVSDTSKGFYRVYDYGFSLSANTKVYGEYAIGTKKPAIFRHVMTPTVSFSFSPSFDQYYNTVQSNKEGATMTYSPYINEMYGVPASGKRAAINFGLANTIEMNAPSSRDTTGYKKIKLIESLSISSNYNFLADSLNLAPFTVSLRTTLFKGLNIQFNAKFDPYQIDENGRKINKFLGTAGGLLRMTELSFNFGYGFQSKGSRQSNKPAINNPKNNSNNITPAQQEQDDFFNNAGQPSEGARAVEQARLMAAQYYDFMIPWSVSFSYVFAYNKPGHKANLTQTINFNGSVNLTEKWGVSFGAGYDFQMKTITPGAVQISRDLHCFQMNFTWIPIGFRQSWSFTIQAKSGMLSDLLKYKKDRSFLDNIYSY